VIAEIVIVAAAGNQWVTKSVDDWVDRRLNRNSDLLGQFVASSRVYDWRFTPAAHDVIDAWPAELAMIAVVFAVTAAALHVLTRDGVSAGRAFLSALLTVVFASVVGAIISGLIVRSLSATYYGYVGASALRPHPSLSDRVTNAFFGPGLSGYTVVGSVALGLLVGIVAALVARRASGDVDPRLAQVRGPAPAAAYGVGAPVAPAVWTPPPPATPPSAFDVGRHSRPD
jgi:hypothetical protein